MGAGQKAPMVRACAALNGVQPADHLFNTVSKTRQALQGSSAHAALFVSEKRAVKSLVRLSGLYTLKCLCCRPLKSFSHCDYRAGRCSFIKEPMLCVKMSFFHLLPIIL